MSPKSISLTFISFNGNYILYLLTFKAYWLFRIFCIILHSLIVAQDTVPAEQHPLKQIAIYTIIPQQERRPALP